MRSCDRCCASAPLCSAVADRCSFKRVPLLRPLLLSLHDGLLLESRRRSVEHEHRPNSVVHQSTQSPQHPNEMRVWNDCAAVVSHRLEELHQPYGHIHGEALRGKRVDADAMAARSQQTPQILHTHGAARDRSRSAGERNRREQKGKAASLDPRGLMRRICAPDTIQGAEQRRDVSVDDSCQRRQRAHPRRIGIVDLFAQRCSCNGRREEGRPQI